MIVEGQSELELLTKVIERFYSDRPKIRIIKANGDIDQAERTFVAIEKIFNALDSSIYRNTAILMLDRPSDQTQGKMDTFLGIFPHLRENMQFFVLPLRDIEQCYADQACELWHLEKKSG